MYRLEDKDILALYRLERDRYCVQEEDCISEDSDGLGPLQECDEDSESSEEGRGSRGVRSSVSLEIHGLQREQPVYFSNREYYRRLEELKSAHLRNMAELERMYISQGEERRWGGPQGEGGRPEGQESLSGSVRRLQRINSQEELDFQETSSGSDQSELCGEDGVGGLSWTGSPDRDSQRTLRGAGPSRAKARLQPSTSCQGLRGRASAGTRSGSKVTVPKPFQMMLREEERKRHKVRTRSEVELENTLLKRELEELRECQKKFRASPAPAHIHLPLYQMLSPRTRGRSGRGDVNNNARNAKGGRASATGSPRPFHFLDRERRKREAKIEAEFGNFGQKVAQHAFRARPMPSWVYGTGATSRSQSVCAVETEVTEGHRPHTCPPPPGPLKKQMELSIEMVKESDTPRSVCRSPQQLDGPEPAPGTKSHRVEV